jgi:hypothetical protein
MSLALGKGGLLFRGVVQEDRKYQISIFIISITASVQGIKTGDLAGMPEVASLILVTKRFY